MNDQRRMLEDMAGGLFGELGPAADFASGWQRITELELTGLLVPEADGGFGGGWDDARAVFRLAGYSAVALPVVEATIAAHLANLAQVSLPGFGTVAAGAAGRYADGVFQGTLTGVAWPEHAGYIAAPTPDGGRTMLLRRDAANLEAAINPAGEPRGVLHAEAAPVTIVPADLFAIGALARTAQIAGALDAALAKSVAYVNERQQFGRPIAKFQAVQQALATFACEAAAVNCAALGAAQAMQRGDAAYEIAAAKLRANMAVGECTAIAHQVHGAIGFTIEYGLHRLTRRLWSWRSDFGSDAHWAGWLGARVAAAGPDRFWADIADRTDTKDTE